MRARAWVRRRDFKTYHGRRRIKGEGSERNKMKCKWAREGKLRDVRSGGGERWWEVGT